MIHLMQIRQLSAWKVPFLTMVALLSVILIKVQHILLKSILIA